MDTNEHYFADGARHLYVPRLNTLSNCSSIGLRAWLSESENYIPIKLPLSGCFEIDFYDISEALSALAHDIVRLTCASFETVDAISEIPNQRKFWLGSWLNTIILRSIRRIAHLKFAVLDYCN